MRPLGLGDILDGTVKLIRSNPKATLGLSAAVGVCAAVPLVIGNALYFREVGGSFPGITQQPQDDSVSLSAVVAQSVGGVVSFVLAFVATTLLTGLLTRVLGRAVFGARITAGEAWRMTRSRVWALLGLALLEALLIALPGALVGGLLIAAGIAFDLLALTVIGGLGLAAGVVFAIFVATRLSLAAAILVLEHRGVIDAMRRSWQLVKGDSWRVFGIILLTQLLIGLISAVVSVPFSLGATALTFLGGTSVAVTVVAAVLSGIGQTLTAMLTYPFTAGVYGLLYADRRMRAEAFDLVLQSAAMRPDETSVDDLWQYTPTGPARP